MESKSYEKAAEEEKLRLAAVAVADSLLDFVMMLDLDGKVIHVNPSLEKACGYKKEELIEKHITEIGPLFSPAPTEYIPPLMKERMGKGSIGPFELPIYMARIGREGVASLTASLIKDAEGKPQYFIMVLRDITELKRVQEKEREVAEAEKKRAAELTERSAALLSILEDEVATREELERAYKELAVLERARAFAFILFKDTLEPLLKECGRRTIGKIRDQVWDLGERLPLAKGVRIGYDGSVALDEVSIRKVLGGRTHEEATSEVTSAFSGIMDACDPIIRADIGDERATATTSRIFSSLFSRPEVSPYRSDLMRLVPDGVEIPREYILLEPRRSYLVEERKPAHAFRIFSEAVRYGSNGLCITPLHPDDAKREYGLGGATVMWLSKHEGISPASLGILRDTIEGFIEKAENTIVILDGLEYLITTNGFDLTLKFLHDLSESITLNRSKLIVPVSPPTLGTKELALLERHMEPIEIVEEE